MNGEARTGERVRRELRRREMGVWKCIFLGMRSEDLSDGNWNV